MALNETMNATLNATINATNQTITSAAGSYWTATFFPTLWERVIALLVAPFIHSEMIYIITPMLITLVLMEFYFGRYTDEDLGWNTAVGHALVLIFVAVDLAKTIYTNMAPGEMGRMIWYNMTHFSAETGEAISTLIAVAIFAIGILLLITDFFHWLPKKLAFFFSGTLQINLIAYLGIVIVYTNNTGASVVIDWYTLLAAVILFVILKFLFGVIHLLEPHYKGKKRAIKKLMQEAPNPVAGKGLTDEQRRGDEIPVTPPRQERE